MPRIVFPGSGGASLFGEIDRPAGQPRAWALFAHCFTCGKDLPAAAMIARTLAAEGIGVLRFDFTGLGESGGDFSRSNFSSNVSDLLAAAAWLEQNEAAPQLMLGHSLGGAAALAAAGRLPGLRGVVTIAAPSDPSHVRHLLGRGVAEAAGDEPVDVLLAGRKFQVRKQLLDDLSAVHLEPILKDLRCATLLLHSPVDELVGIDNAAQLFGWLKHPKSFMTLDDADHLLKRPADAAYAAQVIAAWADRYIGNPPAEDEEAPWVRVRETGGGTFQQSVSLGRHFLVSDEPRAMGGLDSGASPYQLLLAALGSCTAMTLRLYARRKGLPLDRVSVDLRHRRSHEADGEAASDGEDRRLDHIARVIRLEGDLSAQARLKLLDIAERCPVHQTLAGGADVSTSLANDRNEDGAA